ncbi:HD domain-containing phosphohydrolase [Sporomusa sp.]|uniref:HD domain-containing phosphohydrolase n=1 Tax=Sporomusa sp. TaxID=2078658 RepID=UPI002D17A2AC|nr:transporter substrate-binding domain-containing protein [Sporomusa sp.]HWR42991.1 transporter substrate-binding domain-containing protein [Sporomusa sp.]
MRLLIILFVTIWMLTQSLIPGYAATLYKAAGDNSFPPFIYLNDKNQPEGYDIDILRSIERHSGLELEVELMEWSQAKHQVLNGDKDILIGMSKTADRERFYDFSEPYLEMRQVIFTIRDNFYITRPEDLVNRRVAVQRGDIAEELLRSNPEIKLYYYSNQMDALEDLRIGMVDAFVGNYYSGMYWIVKHNLGNTIKVAGKPLQTVNYGFAVKKGEVALLATLNNNIIAAKNSGEVQRLQDKWFGENYFAAFDRQQFTRGITYVSFAIAFIALLALVHVLSLRKQVNQATTQLRTVNSQLTEAYEVTIHAFFKALEHRESGTASHSIEVNKIAMAIGTEMQLSREDLANLNWGTLLHDIGKLAIKDAILLKNGSLTTEEYEIIKQHPQIGYYILKDTQYLVKAAEVALYHHERYDGKGYPFNLQGEDIPLLARICAVADAFEAMIADRPYRKGRPWDEAVDELIKHKGTQFDPQIVDAFVGLNPEQFVKHRPIDRRLANILASD